MKLEEKTMRLIAVGASVAANCQPCLQTNTTKALEEGIGEQEISEAIEVGKMVRRGAANKMDKFITNLSPANAAAVNTGNGGCGCSS
jgi:AhpD family alkylhydroperoxidase